MVFEPVRTIKGKKYLYYNSYSSRKYAEVKAKAKANGKNDSFVIRKSYLKSKPYAVFIHWGGK